MGDDYRCRARALVAWRRVRSVADHCMQALTTAPPTAASICGGPSLNGARRRLSVVAPPDCFHHHHAPSRARLLTRAPSASSAAPATLGARLAYHIWQVCGRCGRYSRRALLAPRLLPRRHVERRLLCLLLVPRRTECVRTSPAPHRTRLRGCSPQASRADAAIPHARARHPPRRPTHPRSQCCRSCMLMSSLIAC